MGSKYPSLLLRGERLPLLAKLFASNVNSTSFQLKPTLKPENPGSPEFFGKTISALTSLIGYFCRYTSKSWGPKIRQFRSEESDSPCQRYYSRLMLFPLSFNSNPHSNQSVIGPKPRHFRSEESDSPCQRYYSRLMLFPFSFNSNPHSNQRIQDLQNFSGKPPQPGTRTHD